MSDFWPQLIEIIISVLIVTGSLTMFLGALGVVRFPNALNRMHAASMAAPLGGACIMISVALFAAEPSVITKALAIIVFVLATSPVAGHAIARAAYISGVDLDPKTVRDDLAGKYDPQTHALAGADPQSQKEDGSQEDSPVDPTPAIKALEKDVQNLKKDVQDLQGGMANLQKDLSTLQTGQKALTSD